MAHDPRLPGSGGCQATFEIAIVEDLMALQIEGKHLPRAKPALFDNAIVVQLDRADFGPGDDQSFGGDLVATWTQAISIERGADEATVGERQPGWTVPWLDDRRVVTIERLHVGRKGGVVLPGGGHERAQRVQNVPPRAFEQMQCFIQAG